MRSGRDGVQEHPRQRRGVQPVSLDTPSQEAPLPRHNQPVHPPAALLSGPHPSRKRWLPLRM